MQLRYKILATLWFFQMALNFDRIVVSFAGPAMLKGLSMGPASLGIILSSFGFGYMIGQIPGGLLADRWRLKTLLIILPIVWGAFTGITGLMVTLSGLVIARAGLGLAEGLAVPAVFRVIGESFDSKTRTGAMAVSSTAGALGPSLAGPLISLVMTAYGWESVFFVMAIPPILAALLIYLVLPSTLNANRGGPATTELPTTELPTAEPSSLRTIIASRSLWACVFGFFFFNIGYWGYHGWMPTYLASARHIDLKQLGFLGSIPYVFAFIGLLSFGWLGTKLHHWRVRLLALAYTLAGVSLYCAFASDEVFGAMVGLCCGSFFLSGSVPLFSSLVFELAPAGGAGSYAGIVFTAGHIGGFIAPVTIGYLVEKSGGYEAGFAFMEIAMFGAAISICFLPLIAYLKARKAQAEPITV